MDMSALLTKMAIFVVLMVIGYFCAKLGAVGPGFAKDASKLVINVFMTATILAAFYFEACTVHPRLIGNYNLVGHRVGYFRSSVVASFAFGYKRCVVANVLIVTVATIYGK